MQITQAPVPPVANPATQPQTLVDHMPSVQAQAVSPISQKAITPTTKSDVGQRTRGRQDKRRDDAPREDGDRGGHVNISV